MRIFITASFKGDDNRKEIDHMCDVVAQSGFQDYCFVRDEKVFDDWHEMMQRAKEEIVNCDALLIEYDGPTHGRMIEMGIAYAFQKKIIIITKKGTFVKESLQGVSNAIIEYEELEDIIEPMKKLLSGRERG